MSRLAGETLKGREVGKIISGVVVEAIQTEFIGFEDLRQKLRFADEIMRVGGRAQGRVQNCGAGSRCPADDKQLFEFRHVSRLELVRPQVGH